MRSEGAVTSCASTLFAWFWPLVLLPSSTTLSETANLLCTISVLSSLSAEVICLNNVSIVSSNSSAVVDGVDPAVTNPFFSFDNRNSGVLHFCVAV